MHSHSLACEQRRRVSCRIPKHLYSLSQPGLQSYAQHLIEKKAMTSISCCTEWRNIHGKARNRVRSLTSHVRIQSPTQWPSCSATSDQACSSFDGAGELRSGICCTCVTVCFDWQVPCEHETGYQHHHTWRCAGHSVSIDQPSNIVRQLPQLC